MKSVTLITLTLVSFLAACASPEVVRSRQSADHDMSCKQLSAAYDEATEFEAKARKERGVTGTNVVAAIFFWPAMIGTYKNTEEAIDAAKERQRHLQAIGAEKGCKI